MEYIKLDDKQKEFYKKRILDMLIMGDYEFVPPLSQRESTTQKGFSDKASSMESILSYHKALMEQGIVGAIDEGVLYGFVSYKENFENEEVTETPNIYVSTLLLHPDMRGKGKTKRMYRFLFDELYPERSIYTRTWSTNFAHIKILESFGFSEIKRIKDHRGEGIDTIYFHLAR